jgi:hypothetical protein
MFGKTLRGAERGRERGDGGVAIAGLSLQSMGNHIRDGRRRRDAARCTGIVESRVRLFRDLLAHHRVARARK